MKNYMHVVCLAIICLMWALRASAQAEFTWSKDIDLPFTDINGQSLTGTEIIHLVAHKGKLYAGNSYWNEYLAPRRGQIWEKSSPSGDWKLDYQMPLKHSRVPSLYSFVFQQDKNGNAVPADTILFAAATYDKGSGVNGPAVLFMRDDETGAWLKTDLGYTNHAFAYTQIRSMGFYRDTETQADIVFAGANPAPTGVYAGRYDVGLPEKIIWDNEPEFTPNGYQRIMGFAVCNDTLYMATQREIYKRVNGANPSQRWVQVFNLATPAVINLYGANIDPYWLNEEDIRGFRAIEDPLGSGQVLIFGALNHIFRLSPKTGYQLLAEQNIESLLESVTESDFHYLQTQIIKDFTDQQTGQTVQLIGFEAFYDTSYLAANPQPNFGGFNLPGWYFERRQSDNGIQYTLKEIVDPAVNPQPDSLARVRTFEISPFPQDSGRVIYAGGFAPWFVPQVTNTAWIYKGVWSGAQVNGFTKFENIAYATDAPTPQQMLDIYVPNGGPASKPVMVYVHGGSWRTGDKANVGQKASLFTQNGYIFVSINYRLSPNPIMPDDPDRIMFPTHPQDVAAAIAWVHNHIDAYGGDAGQICLIGHSAGAHLVALVSTDYTLLNEHGLEPADIQCTCGLDGGAYDIPYYLNQYESPGSLQWNNYVNAFGEDQQVWASASPFSYIQTENIPDFMLVHQGTTQRIDLATHFGQGLMQYGTPVTFLNAAPLDHEGINAALGAVNPQAQVYNDSILFFFTDCLTNTTGVTPAGQHEIAKLEVSPNPASTLLLVRSDQFEHDVKLYNKLGQFVKNHIVSENERQVWIDVSECPPGIYYLQSGQYRAKVLILR